MSNAKAVKSQLIVNHVPGEECRIALVEDGRLEDYFAESESHELHVSNIYKGRVVNVEGAIQAAFVDFGVGRNGFLHVSDLHPMFFPGEDKETTETVGHKTPHRHRPPIQQCLKRGQEILVQVLKEGIGTKGPTLTSYLSIPGRLLVMMPHMEQLGVSRRVEDPEQRRAMREILDSLDLPKGFGFILRTAGLHATKTDLKRDLAYLMRLWKNIETQMQKCKAPAELYVESDLLIRTLRDVLSTEVERIIIDDQSAMQRTMEFLHIASPRRKGPEVVLYDDRVPIFHRFGIEEQVRAMHSRQVPLPSGGSLVIDSAEAAVIIDVNSGKMRQYRDAETTAYKTDLEAIDEIARQLRLRDLGGIVILDLIDMNHTSHRRDVENRLRQLLKRDRAKSEFLKISEFGVIEMTRQRIRPSGRMSHIMPCPACEGRGQVQTAESLAGDTIHDLAYWLQHPKVAMIEMVVSNSVANVLLSRKRRAIVALEEDTGKRVEIRVRPALTPDRVEFYAYDEQNADLDLAKLAESFPAHIARRPEPTPPVEADEEEVGEEAAAPAPQQVNGQVSAEEPPAGGGAKRKRRRRRSKRGRKTADASQTAEGPDAPGAVEAVARAGESADQSRGEAAQSQSEQSEQDDEGVPVAAAPGRKKKKRRRRSRRKDGAEATATTAEQPTSDTTPPPAAQATTDPESAPATPTARKKRRRKKARTAENPQAAESSEPSKSVEAEPTPTAESASAAKPAKKKRRTRKRAEPSADGQPTNASSERAAKDETTSKRVPAQTDAASQTEESPVTKPRRRLYGSRRKLSPGALAAAAGADDEG